MQLLMDKADDKFGRDDCEEYKARILSISLKSKKSIVASFSIFSAKKAFKLLWHVFIQVFIL